MLRIWIFLFTIFVPLFSFAETLELKNGTIIEGKIMEETEDRIKIDRGIGTPITYFKDELKDYRKEDVNEGDVDLPTVFTMDELTPEQRKQVEDNYVTTRVLQVDLSSQDNLIKERPLNAEELTTTASTLYKHGRIQEALAKTQEAIDHAPDYWPAYRVQADILQESGYAEQSIPIYDKILEKNPNDDEVYTNRGYAYGRLNQLERAVEDYNKALELNPKEVHAISARASAYIQLEEVDRAKEDYERLIDFNAEQAYYGLGNVAAYKGNWEEALNYYDKTIAVSSNFAPVYLMKGQVLLQLGREQEAIEAINKAESLGLAIPPDLERSF